MRAGVTIGCHPGAVGPPESGDVIDVNQIVCYTSEVTLYSNNNLLLVNW